MMNENEKLELFETFRKESIDLLEESKVDKETFLSANLAFLDKLNLKPFTSIKSTREALYNYHYYNLLAKKSNLEAQKIIHNPKKKKQYVKRINQRENYYYLKDIATLRFLEIIDYKNIESYYIILKSNRLKGEIFEIHVKSMQQAILHSKNKVILQKLREHKVFDEEERQSLIDSYVNKTY
ncbi:MULTISPECIES: DUF6648 family protein [Anaerococcus]|jgi:hypothetical protein|uniref:Uncharacterized protein n=1 Tax=Anaerococcus octavius TaxID=54007 RepID=A0A2I1M9U5_9FIRM|nr:MULTISPECIES: DUF6648 family protein [Anaerococcus]MBS6105747.1 hypothetical protein [Anaerococcus sp.]MDU2598493.1 DUF6648 family protein [Anaerococcus sp.]MDU3176282.1 DUF6648 family protein [Anaerococcus sp.]MDU4025415.1 DUF6648 family protein [Anaerococcus sp.]MDU7411648.1 DUF6648 family protein [Anaerococcus sp.]